MDPETNALAQEKVWYYFILHIKTYDQN
jgi:hypothetical protein